MTPANRPVPVPASLGASGAITPNLPGSVEWNASKIEQIAESVIRICRTNEPDEVTRKRFRDLAMRCNGVLGVGHATLEEGEWKTELLQWSGIHLQSGKISGKLGDVLHSASQRNVILQMKHTLEDCDVQLYIAPVLVVGVEPEIVLVIAESSLSDMALRRSIEQVAAGLQFWKQGIIARANDWKIASLSAIIDVTDQIESAGSFQECCHVLVNEISHYVGGPKVVLGWMKGKRLQVKAISGESSFDRSSKLVSAMQQCLLESVNRDRIGMWSMRLSAIEQPQLLLHKSLAHQLETEAVVSIPIRRFDGSVIGSWLFAGDHSTLINERFERLLEVITPRIGSAMRLAEISNGRGLKAASRTIGSRFIQRNVVIGSLILMGLVGVLSIPMPYQIRAPIEVKPISRRFIVAPFDGQIEQAKVRVGDEVHEGQTLAILDGRQLRWQLLSVIADKEKLRRSREVELASRNVAGALSAEQELNRVQAEETLLEHKIEQLEIKSPTSGVVLSGSDERAEAASVVVGQPIFEIGSLSSVRIEIYIPSSEIAVVEVGASVRIWLDGYEDQVINTNIKQIRPRSEEHLSKNVFVAEVEFASESIRVRPGMGGKAKIECKKMPIGWNLFHKPIQFLRANFTF